MKPIRLTIEGINSFTEPQTLDFEAVGRNNLFCICGKTGAGKTTVFDSIVLALYGRIGRGNLADVINLSLNTARVEFEFSRDGELYRVVRTFKCRSVDADNGQKKRTATGECELYKNGVPVFKGEQANDVLQSLVGLDEKEFTNVYLLQQGEYAAFLKKTPMEQVETVGKIFSLTRFGEVAARAAERERELSARCDGINQRLDDFGDATPEALKAAKTAAASLRARIAATEKSVQTLQAKVEALSAAKSEYLVAMEKQKTVEQCRARLSEATNKLNSATTELKANADLPHKIAELSAEAARATQEKSALITLAELDAQADAAQADLERKTRAWTAAEQAFNDAKRVYRENTDAFIRIVKEVLESKGALTNNNAAKAEAFTNAARLLDEWVELIASESSEQHKPIDTGATIELLNTETEAIFASAQSAVFTMREAMTRIEQLNKSANAFRADLQEKSKKSVELKEKIRLYSEREKELNAVCESAAAAVESAQARFAEAQLQSAAHAVRAELKAGDACPVCGGVYHGGGLERGVDLNNCKAEIAGCNNALKKAEREKAEQSALTSRAFAELDAIENGTAKVRDDIADIERQLSGIGADYKTFEAERAQLEAFAAKADAYRKAKDALSRSALSEKTALLNGANAALIEAKTRYEDLCAKLSDNRGRAAAALERTVQNETRLNGEIKELTQRFEALQKACDLADAVVQSSTAALNEAQKDSPQQLPEFDEDEFLAQKNGYGAAVEELNTLKAQYAISENTLHSTEERAKTRNSLIAELASVRKDADLYKTIAELTRKKSMLNFVAEEYIRDFAQTAAELLGELSGGKYSIEYSRLNGFSVRDYLNGGKARKTSTLSGGETFLASLSLAIAIARAISGGGNSFFFLDEGFGTLDPELIDVVVGALETLSRDCLVGVISHSAELIDRMPMRVEVKEATDVKGSVLDY